MIKIDLVNRVAETSQVSRVKAALAVDTIFLALKHALRDGFRSPANRRLRLAGERPAPPNRSPETAPRKRCRLGLADNNFHFVH